ncbi:MAG: GNAT family N-acetyltransferase [Armatimonas sp.]
MPLELKRLCEVAPADIIELMNHPQVRALMPLATGPFGPEECKGFVEGKEALWQEFGYGPWAFVIDGEFAGWGGFQPEDDDVDLALVLHPKHWGQGRLIYPALIARGFSEWDFSSITVLFPPARTRIKAIFKLGFQPDGEVTVFGELFHRFRLPRPAHIPRPITTERLILRPLHATDAADVLIFRGDPEVQKYDDPPISSLDESLAFIEELNADSAAQKCRPLGIVLKETRRVIGLVNLWHWDSYHRHAEVGYGIALKYWGLGLGQEAVCAAALYGFQEMNLRHIYARTSSANDRSLRMLERLRFVREGTLRQHILEDDGQFYDSVVFGLLREDWGISCPTS